MPFLVLDIETLKQDPETWAIPNVAELEPPATHKKPDTIAKWREEKALTVVDELRDRSSLEPLLGGTVLAVGLARDGLAPTCLLAPTGDETGERRVLQQLESGLAKYPDHTIVTFNGTRFDLVWLAKRGLRHGLYSLANRCQRASTEKPWQSRMHVDLFAVWQGPDRQARGRLHEVAAFLGVESDDKVTGKQISELFAAGDVEAVRRHVLEDVRLTREVYWRFVAAGWVEGEECAAELPVRPPRVSRREQLEAEVRRAQIDGAAQDLRRCAEAAGIPWREGTDDGESAAYLTKDTTSMQLQAYLEGLRALHGGGA
jgi:hypothetical protein